MISRLLVRVGSSILGRRRIRAGEQAPERPGKTPRPGAAQDVSEGGEQRDAAETARDDAGA